MAERILIVDDEELIRSIFTNLFKKEKHDVEAVSSGEEAIEVLENNDFEVVLLDISLPGMTGIEVLKKLKKDKPGLIVIIMTAFGYDEELIAETKSIGCNGYIGKNMPVSQILGNFRMFVQNAKNNKNKKG